VGLDGSGTSYERGAVGTNSYDVVAILLSHSAPKADALVLGGGDSSARLTSASTIHL